MSAVEQLYSADIVEIVLDLPFPPSVNHIWKRSKMGVYRAPKYMRWLAQSDIAVMATKQFPRRKIHGAFETHILLNEEAGTGDCDNRIKCVLDWAVSRDVVPDDKHCRKLTIEWVSSEMAPAGARVTLRSLHEVAR